jgi:glycosyltransferase involved in cell wall biosynthesis
MLHPLNGFDRTLGRFVASFIYISRAVAENYTSQGISPSKGAVIHNAVDLNEYSQTYDALSVRSEFGWTSGEPLVGIVGRLDWWKGHEYFLQAMALVRKQLPNARGLIVGQVDSTPRGEIYVRKLESLARALRLEDRLIFTGFRPDVPRIMSALDVVVLGSAEPEPFGRVVIEGMAAGKPVVATAAGGVLDIVEDGFNGLLVPRRDSQAMAEAILSILLDKEKAARMGQAGRQTVIGKFSLEHHVDAVQKLYESC